MAIGVVATIKIKAGENAGFEAAAKALVAKVTSSEPGCLLYALHKGNDSETYVFLERYADEAALKHHGSTDYFKELGGKMGPFMAGRPDVQRYVEVD
jgi:quinol monooxygenase YgiN